jgi:hypothetical protein
MPTIIDALYEQNREAIAVISRAEEISVASDVDNKLKKHLVMAAASYFETEVRTAIEKLVESASSGNAAVLALVKKKALERQYHTYFNWEGRNANTFFSYFGEEFGKKCKEDVKASDDLASAISAFLELGEMRNKLAHLNFAQFPIEKTSDEIYTLYQSALKFLEYIETALDEAGKPRPELEAEDATQK